MSYSLFGNDSNFTEVLIGKTDAKNMNEKSESNTLSISGRSSPTHSTTSDSSSDNIDSPNNLFLLKVLDSLLEVCQDGYKIHLTTQLPPPAISRGAHRSFSTPPPLMAYPVPPLRHTQRTPAPSQFLPHQFRHPFVPVPLVPTRQLMTIPPPTIRYYHP